MRRNVAVQRPTKHREVLQRAGLPSVARQVVVPSGLPAVRPDLRVRPVNPPPPLESGPTPYVDYSRRLTAEGGVLIFYKDFDRRLRHTLWRLSIWAFFSGYEGWFLFHQSAVHSRTAIYVCLAVVALINWLIVRKPVEIYRNVELRPDCMILEGAEVFWARNMEAGFPSFRSDNKGNRILGGTYGTRFVEYLTVPKFNEFDRAPEVFGAHLRDAMQQLWTRPQ